MRLQYWGRGEISSSRTFHTICQLPIYHEVLVDSSTTCKKPCKRQEDDSDKVGDGGRRHCACGSKCPNIRGGASSRRTWGDIQWPWHIPKLIHWWNMKVVPAKVGPERLGNRALEDEVITCFCKLSAQLTGVVVENILFM